MRTVFLCLFSSFLGAVVAVMLVSPPNPEPRLIAQEPYRRPQAYAPPAGPSLPVPSATMPPVSPRVPGSGAIAAASYPDLTPEEAVNVAVYEKVNRGVVNISTKSVRSDGFLWVDIPEEGAGSGAVLDREGHLLTNFHVVEGARDIQVTLFDGKPYEARLIGADPQTDVAVLKIDAPPESLYPVVLGDSTNLLVGQKVYAIGNPFGLERTLTTGIISSVNRSIDRRGKLRWMKFIQIDADINPGNSGGPLLSTKGEMIGMNTAIASGTGESVGVGFAIPSSSIARVVPELIQRGHVVRADIGIAQVYQTDAGLLIAALVPQGAAERAGLKGPQIIRRRRQQGFMVWEQTQVDRSAADLIVGVDGERVKTAGDFMSIIESHRPGDIVTLNIIRAGKQMNVPVTLSASE